MDDQLAGMNVPIELRSHEQKQLAEFIPRIEDSLRDSDLTDQADTVGDFSFTVDHTDEVAGKYASAPAEDWAAVLQYLSILRPDEGLRVWWLQKKLSKRLQARLAEMDVEGDDEE